jgi:hypothetical protein
MTHQPPILAYASPLASPLAASLSAGAEFSASLAPPPTWPAVMACAAGAAVPVAGAGLLLWISLAGNAGWYVVGATTGGTVILLGMAAFCAHAGWLQWRYGELPNAIVVRNGILSVASPGRWGLRARHVAVADITHCRAASLGRSLTGTRLYTVRIYYRPLQSVEVHCVAANHATVDAVVENLRWAIGFSPDGRASEKPAQ